MPLLETIGDLRAAGPLVEEILDRSPAVEARGDGRLLRLGQGRWLPGGAVGDLPRPGGADEDHGRPRCRAHRLPRPWRIGRPGGRPDPRRHPRPAAGRRGRAAEADRAGRDDRVQVRPPGVGGAESRGRRGRDVADGVPGRGRPGAAERRRPRHDGRARRRRQCRVPRARLGRPGLPGVLSQLYPGRRARAARDRVTARLTA